ncbi:MAG TPA: sugar ABC transporter ATP-binding protein [Candidatus Dormibacteraeota bacterium]|nr:sugar ABC transporter ATP-binding protein [Candidatus Dormibacteraeota bacterium]
MEGELLNDHELQASPAPLRTSATVPVVEVRHLSKTFGGERALIDVHFSVLPGEIHGLVGENGSGKSTLIKVLAGFHVPERGSELLVDGRAVPLPLRPGQFRELGMAFVHQDLALIPSLTAAENLYLGELVASNRWWISWRAQQHRAAGTFRRYGLRIDPGAEVARLGQVERALLAIVRAAEEMRRARGTRGSGLLLLDEPTAFLPREGVDRLFALMRQIAAGGAGVVFVSHHLDEVLEVTDRVTVLRDGRVVATSLTAEVSHERLVEMIIGRRLEGVPRPEAGPIAGDGALMAAEGVTAGGLENCSLYVGRGEIVGVTGLVGSGFSELPYALFGARRARGTLALEGRRYDLGSLRPAQAVRVGIALVPADRLAAGSVADLSVVDNLSLQVFRQNGPWLDRGRLRREAGQLVRRFDVRPPDPDLTYQSLSGGNQQKVLLARWLRTAPRLLLLDEPTIGVDVGAREQIFDLIRETAASGVAVLCSSADHEQLAALCHRVYVVARGRIVAELRGDEVTEGRIAERCLIGSWTEGRSA